MFATVTKVNKSKGLVKLDHLGRETNWLPCVGGTPSLGQQVAFMEHDNDGTGVVFGSTSMTDGSPISLHFGGIDLQIDGATVTGKMDVDLTGDMTVKGNLSVDGNIETTGTVTDEKGDLTNFQTTDGAQRQSA